MMAHITKHGFRTTSRTLDYAIQISFNFIIVLINEIIISLILFLISGHFNLKLNKYKFVSIF